MNKKCQSSIELVILIGTMFFLFLSFLFVFQQNLNEKAYEKRDFEINELALNVQNEIAIAATASDGYQRNFEVPQELFGVDYTISLVSNSVYIITSDEKHAMSLSVQNVSGQIWKGDNFIRKVNGEVYLN